MFARPHMKHKHTLLKSTLIPPDSLPKTNVFLNLTQVVSEYVIFSRMTWNNYSLPAPILMLTPRFLRFLYSTAATEAWRVEASCWNQSSEIISIKIQNELHINKHFSSYEMWLDLFKCRLESYFMAVVSIVQQLLWWNFILLC